MLDSDGGYTPERYGVPLLSSTGGTLYALEGSPFSGVDKGLCLGAEGVQRSPEWLATRPWYFGASSPCAAFGVFDLREDLNPGMSGDFPTALMAMAEVVQGADGTGAPATCGPPDPVMAPPPPGVAMRKGTCLEDRVAARVEWVLRIPTIPGGVYVDPVRPYIRVSLDRTTVWGLPIELKSTLRPPSGGVVDTPPFYYVLQCLMQARVVGAPAALLAICYLDTPEYEEEARREAGAPSPLRARVDDVPRMCELWRTQKLEALAGGVPHPGYADTLDLFTVTRTARADAFLDGLYNEAWGLVCTMARRARESPMPYVDVRAAWKGIVASKGGVEVAQEVAAECTQGGVAVSVQQWLKRPSCEVKLGVIAPAAAAAPARLTRVTLADLVCI